MHSRPAHRKSLRLPGYDYSSPGAYFITVCSNRRACLFGEISDTRIVHSEVGGIVSKWWAAIPEKFPGVELDEFIVMPNHLHGIIVIVGADPCVCPREGEHTGSPLPRIMQWFKTMSTNEYLRAGAAEARAPSTDKRLWQRNYYEHIIRNEDDLSQIREYVVNNAHNWRTDSENPENIRP